MIQESYLTLLTYFIAILQWSIGHPSSASIDGGFWLELVVRQMMFSRIPPKQCASRWLWGVHVIFFLAGSILESYHRIKIFNGSFLGDWIPKMGIDIREEQWIRIGSGWVRLAIFFVVQNPQYGHKDLEIWFSTN
jgi:hypothetical protein